MYHNCYSKGHLFAIVPDCGNLWNFLKINFCKPYFLVLSYHFKKSLLRPYRQFWPDIWVTTDQELELAGHSEKNCIKLKFMCDLISRRQTSFYRISEELVVAMVMGLIWGTWSTPPTPKNMSVSPLTHVLQECEEKKPQLEPSILRFWLKSTCGKTKVDRRDKMLAMTKMIKSCF